MPETSATSTTPPKAVQTADSIFTKIINRELPAKIVFENDEFIAFHDIDPKSPVHVLVVTKQPFESLEAIPQEDAQFHARLLQTVRQIAHQLEIADNYKVVMNVGKKMQLVPHLHIHLLGGWQQLPEPLAISL